MSDGRRWPEIAAAFDELVELEPARRAERLAAISTADPELHSGIEKLLAADATADVRLARIDTALAAPARAAARKYDADPLKLVGRTFSHFRVIELFAHGGMGVVYRAEDTHLRRMIALKFPLPAQAFSPVTKQRFLQEARAGGSLDHPNLCSIYEAGETEDGHLFIAMPLYAGETLRRRLAREGALAPAHAVAIARQIAQGLTAAHHAGVIHRDLKPANVMVLQDGTIKILDFGLAKASDLALTTSHALLGTALYMAPEQIQGGPIDARTDMWALGVVLYEMLTGRRPFVGEHDVAIAHAIIHGEPVAPATHRREVTPELQLVVQRLLQKSPSQRYASAAAVVADLDALERGEGTASSSTRRPAFALAVSRRLLATIVLAVSGIIVVALAARLLRDGSSAPATISLAVLPFQNLSGNTDDEHLAIGLSHEIGAELGRLPAFVMPGYISTIAYRDTSAAMPQIARALQAAALVTGTVQRMGDRVRIDVTLFDARTNRQLWTMPYERALTDVRDVQPHAARAIVKALGIRLRDTESALLQRMPATNGRAYDLYLRGRSLELSGLPRRGSDRLPDDVVRRAQSFYSRARESDPNFALARARLALMHMRSASTYDTTEARREQARLEAEAALRLQPGPAEGHEALSMYWRRRNDLPKAVEEMQRAVAASSNSADLHDKLGVTYVAMGRLDDALVELDRAMQLDPTNPDRAFKFAVYALRARRDAEAMRAFDRAIQLAPDYHMVRVIKGHTYLRAMGIPDTLEAVMRSIPVEWDPNGMATWARYSVLRVQRRYAVALAMLDAARTELSRDGLVYHPKPLMRAELYAAMGETTRARAYFDTARVLLEDSVAARPRDASIRVSLALSYAGLGRKADAAIEARRALELVPLSQANPQATAFMGAAVEVFGRIGELDTAFELVELMLAMPAGREITVPWLRISPTFDPLRGDPRLAGLLARFSRE